MVLIKTSGTDVEPRMAFLVYSGCAESLLVHSIYLSYPSKLTLTFSLNDVFYKININTMIDQFSLFSTLIILRKSKKDN